MTAEGAEAAREAGQSVNTLKDAFQSRLAKLQVLH